MSTLGRLQGSIAMLPSTRPVSTGSDTLLYSPRASACSRSEAMLLHVTAAHLKCQRVRHVLHSIHPVHAAAPGKVPAPRASFFRAHPLRWHSVTVLLFGLRHTAMNDLRSTQQCSSYRSCPEPQEAKTRSSLEAKDRESHPATLPAGPFIHAQYTFIRSSSSEVSACTLREKIRKIFWLDLLTNCAPATVLLNASHELSSCRTQ